MEEKNVKKKFACSVTVGTKGQIVIPKEMREMFGIESGDSLLLLADIKKGMVICFCTKTGMKMTKKMKENDF